MSVDCHRWHSRGESVLKHDGWIDRLGSSNLELVDVVDSDLEREELEKARLCLIRARRSMIQYEGVDSVQIKSKS